MADSAVAVLEGVLSPEGLIVPTAEEPWTVGGRAPDAVALPATDDEAAAVIRIAGERGWTVAAAGQGPRVRSRAPDSRTLLVVSVSRMRGIVRYEPADLTVRAGAGITVGELDGRVRRERQRLVLDPPGAPARTLGSVLAAGEYGPLHAGFGRPRDQVLGLVLVTGDGRVLRLGGDVVKNVAGFDLVKLAVGSRGTLGVITEAALRLHPLSERDVTARASLADPNEGAAALRAVALLPYPLAALELFLPPPGEASPPGGSVLAVRVMGSRTATERMLEAVRSALDPWAAPVEEEGEGGAEIFRSAGEREERSPLGLRIRALPSQAAEAVAGARRFLDSLPAEVVGPGSRAGWICVHGTAGTLRLGVDSPEEEVDWATVRDPLTLLEKAVRERGGSIRALRAPAALCSLTRRWGPEGPVAGLVTGLRRAFDPAGVLAGGGE